MVSSLVDTRISYHSYGVYFLESNARGNTLMCAVMNLLTEVFDVSADRKSINVDLMTLPEGIKEKYNKVIIEGKFRRTRSIRYHKYGFFNYRRKSQA